MLFDLQYLYTASPPLVRPLSGTNTTASIRSTDSNDFKEVYHVPGNRFTYHDAKAVCKAFDGEMATYEQVLEEQKKGASWCSFGWTKDQLGVYPTSQNHFDKLQKIEGHEYDCG